MEKWKVYKQKYLISNHGNIVSLYYEGSKSITKPLSLNKRKDGYLQVEINKEKKLVHRIIAELFIENPNNYDEVNHKNGIKTDNNVENLEWCTHSYNMVHSYMNNLHKKYCSNNHWNCKKILQYDLNNNFIKKYNSIEDANKEFGKNKTHISDVCIGKRKTALGYIWKYEQ